MAVIEAANGGGPPELAPVEDETPAIEGGVLQGANYAQRTFSQTFSSQGALAGETVDGLAVALQSGEKAIADVTVQ
jgi:hypothetical protein